MVLLYTMSHKKAQALESLQQVLTTVRQFEMKLDKLQDDVDYHGRTLTDLRNMVGNLTGPAEPRINQDIREEPKRVLKKNTATQHDFHEEATKTKKKTAIQPFSAKIKAKSVQGQKYGMRAFDKEPPFLNKMPILNQKYSMRTPKGESPRKARTLRSQKSKVDKWRSKPL